MLEFYSRIPAANVESHIYSIVSGVLYSIGTCPFTSRRRRRLKYDSEIKLGASSLGRASASSGLFVSASQNTHYIKQWCFHV